MTDKRLGRDATETTERVWPETTILGVKEYSKQSITVALGGGAFCVVDNFIDQTAKKKLLAELQAIVDSSGAKPIKKGD